MILQPPPSEHEVKLQLLLSISRSQNALARILDSMADISAYSEETALQLAQNAERLVRYQQAMASMVSGIELYRQYTGTPSPPWLNRAEVSPLEQVSEEEY